MGDVSDVFDFDLPTLDYNDRPLGGWLQHKVTGSWYAFFCDEIIAGLLAHWTLVRAEKGDSTEDAYDALARASQDENGVWLSIVADVESARIAARRRRSRTEPHGRRVLVRSDDEARQWLSMPSA